MRRVKALVRRDERLSIPITVGVWEIPILQFIHSAENVKVEDAVVVDRREYPDPEAEFDRLSRKYGEDIKQEKSYVSLVYGQPPIGVRELARVIESEKALDAPAEADVDPLA